MPGCSWDDALPLVSLLSTFWIGFTICGGTVVCGTEAIAEAEVGSYHVIVAAASIHTPGIGPR